MSNGDNSLILDTVATGTLDVAAKEQNFPRHWKTPKGNIVFNITLLINIPSVGIVPLGNWFNEGKLTMQNDIVKQYMELMKNWNCPTNDGKGNCVRISFVSWEVVADTKYHTRHVTSTLTDTGGINDFASIIFIAQHGIYMLCCSLLLKTLT